jgi:hypothetical protein
MKNQIATTRDAGNELNRPSGRAKLPIEAHATMVIALTVELDRILAIRPQMERLRRKIVGTDVPVQERDASHAEFLAAKHQLPSDIASLDSSRRANAPLPSKETRRTSFAQDRVARNGDRQADPVRIFGEG